MTDQPAKRVTVLGVIALDDHQALGLSIPPDATPEQISTAILKANAEKQAAAIAETEHLKRKVSRPGGDRDRGRSR
jgi:hypothetical protein